MRSVVAPKRSRNTQPNVPASMRTMSRTRTEECPKERGERAWPRPAAKHCLAMPEKQSLPSGSSVLSSPLAASETELRLLDTSEIIPPAPSSKTHLCRQRVKSRVLTFRKSDRTAMSDVGTTIAMTWPCSVASTHALAVTSSVTCVFPRKLVS